MRMLRSLGCAFVLTVVSGCGSPAPQPELTPSPQAAPLLTVTPAAVNELARLTKREDAPGDWHLRLRAVPGGCCGYLQKLDLDITISPTDDHTLVADGVRVVLFKRQVEMFRGAEVDYGTKDGHVGFMINNPNFEGEAARKWVAILAGDAPPRPVPTPAERAEEPAPTK